MASFSVIVLPTDGTVKATDCILKQSINK